MNVILDGLEAEVTKFMAANSRKIARIQVDFRVKYTNASPDRFALLKETALTCPVALSLHPEIAQEVTFQF